MSACEIALRKVNATEHLWWEFNIGSGNGLVPSGNKPLPDPILTQIPVAIGRHYSLGHNELFFMCLNFEDRLILLIGTHIVITSEICHNGGRGRVNDTHKFTHSL